MGASSNFSSLMFFVGGGGWGEKDTIQSQCRFDPNINFSFMGGFSWDSVRILSEFSWDLGGFCQDFIGCDLVGWYSVRIWPNGPNLTDPVWWDMVRIWSGFVMFGWIRSGFGQDLSCLVGYSQDLVRICHVLAARLILSHSMSL